MGRRQGGMISEVERGSLGYRLGLRPGDRIISVNGRTLRDELDYRFYASDAHISLTVESRGGRSRAISARKDEDDLLGIRFEEPLFDEMRTCRNHCVFCFVRQIPDEMRESLHVRDDDYRMSFLYGNFISLTNLSEEDWARLEEQRLSPIRVSVHSTDEATRSRLMGNPEAGRIMEHLRRLAGLGIRVHAQIVLLRDKNDGLQLVNTLADLDSLGEAVVSVGVVPAVYTKYRKTLPSPPIDKAWASGTLDLIEDFAGKVYSKRGDNWVYGADELYYLAGRPFPPYEYYGEFHQFDNGIGMVADFRHSLGQTRREPRSGPRQGLRKAVAVSGEMAKGEIQSAIEKLGLSSLITLCPVRNQFFGDTVTCSGLLTGQDIAAALNDFLIEEGASEAYGEALIPSISLFGGAFLDDMTPAGLEKACGIKVMVVEPSPEGLSGAVETLGRKE